METERPSPMEPETHSPPCASTMDWSSSALGVVEPTDATTSPAITYFASHDPSSSSSSPESISPCRSPWNGLTSGPPPWTSVPLPWMLTPLGPAAALPPAAPAAGASASTGASFGGDQSLSARASGCVGSNTPARLVRPRISSEPSGSSKTESRTSEKRQEVVPAAKPAQRIIPPSPTRALHSQNGHGGSSPDTSESPIM
mmetsp:Transcript_37388/g.111241  ORF Transcript_37388/g.111241 Transcript_37388/m.111241 type:complete len:200 (-) Transcript_37388:504-1103(-)